VTPEAHSMPQSSERGRGHRLGLGLQRNWPSALLVVPGLVLLGLFYVLPNLLNLAYAFTDWSSFTERIGFVGLGNFGDLLRTGVLGSVLLVTFKFAFVVTILGNVVALLLALALEKPTRLNIFLRAFLFIPVLLSALAAGYAAAGLLQFDGVVNQILSLGTRLFGAGPVEVQWLGSTDWTIFVAAAVYCWKTGGILMLIYIAGLMAVPHDLVEAARIDGASPLQVVRRVKLPLLGPAFTFNIALTLIGALSVFDVILALTRGGPARTTSVLNYVVFEQFGGGFYGYSVAISFVLVLIIIVVAIPIIWFLRRREVEL